MERIINCLNFSLNYFLKAQDCCVVFKFNLMHVSVRIDTFR